MASSSLSHTLVSIVILVVLQPCPATSDDNTSSSIFSPIFDNICKQVECGKGSCKASSNGSLGFVCECEPGWKQTRLLNEDTSNFLPCVIPDCNFNMSCPKVPAPAPEKAKQANSSLFDPCHWADCGGGVCNRTSPFMRRCECNEGYTNLFNNTIFPCFSECALNMDCAGLGIGMTNTTSSPPSNLPDRSTSTATSICRGDYTWLIILALSLALLPSSR